MKKIVPIALLVLLLYHTFGLSFAIFFFDDQYQAAAGCDTGQDMKLMKMYLPSLPYSGDIEVSAHVEGLVRKDGNFYNPTSIQHQNDTLYVTLQSNQAARDHFFELANAMQTVADPQTDTPNGPYGKMIKLLGNLLKIYVPNQQVPPTYASHLIDLPHCTFASIFKITYRSFENTLSTPPPELS